VGQNCYITFSSIHQAIRAEELLEEERYAYKMVPVPRSISSSCGSALQCTCRDITAIGNFLRDWDIEIEGLYRVKEAKLRALSVKKLS